MEDDPHSDEEILEILKMKKVAVVGMSKNPDKAAHYVPKYLHDNGYDITPVNPNADVILKKQCYDEGIDPLDPSKKIRSEIPHQTTCLPAPHLRSDLQW